MSDQALFWFLFPQALEMVLCAVGISATAILVTKRPAVGTGEKS